MVTVTKCDGCGMEGSSQRSEVQELYSIQRWDNESHEQGDFCKDCLPDEIIDALNNIDRNPVEEF